MIASVLGQVLFLGRAAPGSVAVVVGDAFVLDVGLDRCPGGSRPDYGRLLSFGGDVIPGHGVEPAVELEVEVTVERCLVPDDDLVGLTRQWRQMSLLLQLEDLQRRSSSGAVSSYAGDFSRPSLNLSINHADRLPIAPHAEVALDVLDLALDLAFLLG